MSRAAGLPLRSWRRGDTVERRLEIDMAEAEIVREIYRLYLAGEGSLGIKAVVDHLNGAGHYRARGLREG